jgi:tetratricopeptide (TPR) repeat protein
MAARGLRLALVLGFVLGGSVRAAAEGDPRPIAARHFQRGKQLFGEARYLEALAAFQAGYDVLALPGFLVNIGQCQRKLGQLDDASASFRQFLNGGTGAPELRAEIRDALAEIEKERSGAPPPPPAPVEEAPPPAADAPAEKPVDLTAHDIPPDPPQRVEHRTRWWAWTLAAVLVAGALAAGIAVAVLETAGPRAGSLGLFDGRR